MRWEIRYKRSVEKDVERLPKRLKKPAIAAILDLGTNPYPEGRERVKPANTRFALRLGSYRIVYSIMKESKIVEIEFVGHRRDAYRWF